MRMKSFKKLYALIALTLLPSLTAHASPNLERYSVVPKGAILIKVSDNANTIVRKHPSGTAFVFEDGTHYGVAIYPKSGQSFWANPVGKSVILDGQGKNKVAFDMQHLTTNVGIYHLIIQNYTPVDYFGVIDCGSQYWTDGKKWKEPTNCTIFNVDLINNTGEKYSSGIVVGSGTRVLGGRITDNYGQGIWGHGKNILIDGVEIARNSKESITWHAGGIKFAVVHDSIIRNSSIHNNNGPGIWYDVNSDNNLIEGNEVRDNSGPGIMYEISRRAIIRDNNIENNSWKSSGWFHDGGIFLSTSFDCIVENNTLNRNRHGLWSIDQRTVRNDSFRNNSFEPKFGRIYDHLGKPEIWRGADNIFKNNTIIDSGQNGATAAEKESIGSDIYLTTKFIGNVYQDNGNGGNTWYWGKGFSHARKINFNRWQSIGNDL